MKQTAETLEQSVTRTIGYPSLVCLPDHLSEQPSWPLILFLHGAGERGHDLERVKTHGPLRLIANGGEFPFIIVAPQCPVDQWWKPESLGAVLDAAVRRYPIDQDRIYVTGLSMGGYGTWALAIEQPTRFAAIAPICGGGIPFLTGRIRHLPVWAFHGAADDIVPLSESERMVQALKDYGGDVRLTVYPDIAHNAWDPAYSNPEVYAWMLQQRRRPNQDVLPFPAASPGR